MRRVTSSVVLTASKNLILFVLVSSYLKGKYGPCPLAPPKNWRREIKNLAPKIQKKGRKKHTKK